MILEDALPYMEFLPPHTLRRILRMRPTDRETFGWKPIQISYHANPQPQPTLDTIILYPYLDIEEAAWAYRDQVYLFLHKNALFEPTKSRFHLYHGLAIPTTGVIPLGTRSSPGPRPCTTSDLADIFLLADYLELAA